MFERSISIKTLQHYFFTKVAVVTTSTILGFTVLQANLVQAATITYDFTVDINVGSLSGSTGRGFFSYDNSLPLINTFFLGRPIASLFFEFDGKTFTLTDSNLLNFIPVIFNEAPPNNPEHFGLYGFSVSGSVTAPPEEQFVTTHTKNFTIDNDDFYYSVKEVTGIPDFHCSECITYTLREASIVSVPEPNALGGLFLLSLGVVLKKKAELRKASSFLSKISSN
jgi:hypothetical protein